MADRSIAELGAGFAVLVLAGGFLTYAVSHTGITTGGTPLTARFGDITGLGLGADVRIGGVKIGSVTSETLDPQTFQAVVGFDVAPAIKVPKDSSAVIATEGLLGGNYLQIQPGGDSTALPPHGQILVTQSAINLQSLLGKFIFNGAGAKPQPGQNASQGAGPAGAPAAAQAAPAAPPAAAP